MVKKKLTHKNINVYGHYWKETKKKGKKEHFSTDRGDRGTQERWKA